MPQHGCPAPAATSSIGPATLLAAQLPAQGARVRQLLRRRCHANPKVCMCIRVRNRSACSPVYGHGSGAKASQCVLKLHELLPKQAPATTLQGVGRRALRQPWQPGCPVLVRPPMPPSVALPAKPGAAFAFAVPHSYDLVELPSVPGGQKAELSHPNRGSAAQRGAARGGWETLAARRRAHSAGQQHRSACMQASIHPIR